MDLYFAIRFSSFSKSYSRFLADCLFCCLSFLLWFYLSFTYFNNLCETVSLLLLIFKIKILFLQQLLRALVKLNLDAKVLSSLTVTAVSVLSALETSTQPTSTWAPVYPDVGPLRKVSFSHFVNWHFTGI